MNIKNQVQEHFAKHGGPTTGYEEVSAQNLATQIKEESKMGTVKLLPQDIATEQQVVHPALDWRDDVLLMGVRLGNGGRAVLTSQREIVSLDRLKWPICERALNFSRSPITENVAHLFQTGHGTAENPETAYALVNVVERLATYYRRFVIFGSPWWPELLALWTLGTYLYPIFSAYPYLRISSPEPGCGKSLLGQIISSLSFNGELMASPTEANIFRIAESERGTQVWDEVENQHDADKSRLQAMQASLLNGYRAGGAVPRQERGRGGRFETVRFHVYVPRVLIGLSELPQVVQQRTLELILHRRGTDERVERYHPDERAHEEKELREVCALYALSYCGATSRQYRRQDLAERLERHLGQAGRLPNDLLLPLVAVAAGPIDGDKRSRGVILPLLTMLFSQVAPSLSSCWNEAATTTPAWLPAALDILESSGELEPAELASRVSELMGISISSERLSRGLKTYGIRSEKRNGRRLISASVAQIAQLRSRYGIALPEAEPVVTATLALPVGQ